VAHKRARKSGSRRGGKSARAFLGSPQKRKEARGIRTRRQAQLEDEEEVVKQEDIDEVVVKKEDDNTDDRDLGLPSIDVFNARS
jgi:hypothetical protein